MSQFLQRIRRVSAVAVAVATIGGLSLIWLASSTPANAADVTVTVHPVSGANDLSAVSCSTATTCVGVGGATGGGVVVPIVDGVPQTAAVVSGMSGFDDIACIPGGACVAVGLNQVQFQGGGGTQQGIVVAVSGTGVPGSAQVIANTYEIEDVACEPTTTTCIATGIGGNPIGGVVVKVTDGTAGAAQVVADVGQGFTDVACASATVCEAVGFASNGEGRAVTITSGTAEAARPVPGTGELDAIACPSATSCEAVGSAAPQGGAAVTLTNGVPGTVHTVSGVDLFEGVGCRSAIACVAEGGLFSGTQAHSVTAIDNGVPGSPQTAPAYLGENPGQLVSCATSTTCIAIGFSGTGNDSIGQVIPVNSGVAATPIAATGTALLRSVTCPTATRCIAVGDASGFTSAAVADIAVPASTDETTLTTAPPGAQAAQITTGPGAGGGPHVRSFDTGGTPVGASFYAYSPSFTGGVPVARGDLNGDGVDEIVTGSGPGAAVFSVFSSNGTFQFSRSPFGSFTGGVDVAIGDVTGDSTPEIVVAAGAGGGPHVKIYSAAGEPIGTGFYAFESEFRGGVHVAVGHLGGDKADIIAGAGPGGNPAVNVFSAGGALAGPGGFVAYDSAFRGGVYVAAGNVLGDAVDEIITGAGAGGGPHVRVWNSAATAIAGWMAYPQAFAGGVRVAAGDLSGAGTDAVVTGAGPGGGPQVRGFTGTGSSLPTSFYAYAPTMNAGVFVAVSSARAASSNQLPRSG